VVNDLDGARADTVATAIRDAGGRAVACPFDVASSRAVDTTIDTIVREHGSIDVLVNSAGFLRNPPAARERQRAWDERRGRGEPWGSLHATVAVTDELWHSHVSVLLDGVFFCTRAALRHMEARGRGAIVNVASIGGITASPGVPYYAAAKAGVIALTRSIGVEVAGAGVRVNAVAPGPVDTEILGPSLGSASPLAARTPIGRLGDPAEVAAAILFLASDAASFCCGEVLTVSGGFQ